MEKQVKTLIADEVLIEDLRGKRRIHMDGVRHGSFITLLSDKGSAITFQLLFNGQTGLSVNGDPSVCGVCLGTHIDISGSLGIRDERGLLMIDLFTLPWSNYPRLIIRTVSSVLFKNEDKGTVRYEDWDEEAHERKTRNMPKTNEPAKKKRPKVLVANKMVINDLNDQPRIVMDATEDSRSFVRLIGYLGSSIEMSVTHQGLSKLVVCGNDGIERVSLVADPGAAGKITINDVKGRPTIVLGMEAESNLPAIIMLKDDAIVCKIPKPGEN